MKPKEVSPQPAPLELIPHGAIAKGKYEEMFQRLNRIEAETGIHPGNEVVELWKKVDENNDKIEELDKQAQESEGQHEISQALLEIERLGKENDTLFPEVLRRYKTLLVSKGIDTDAVFEPYEKGLLTPGETGVALKKERKGREEAATSPEAAIAQGRFQEMLQRIDNLVKETEVPTEREALRLWLVINKNNEKIKRLFREAETDGPSPETERKILETRKLGEENDLLFADFLKAYANSLTSAGIDPETAFGPREKGILARANQAEGQAVDGQPETGIPAQADPQATAAVETKLTRLETTKRSLEKEEEAAPATREEIYARYKATLKKRMREESDARAKKGFLKQLGASDKKISQNAEDTNGVSDLKRQYLEQTEEYIQEERRRIRTEAEAAAGENDTLYFEKIAQEQDRREQSIRAAAAEDMYRARIEARTEILPTKARETVRKGAESFARFNKKHPSVKYVVGGTAIFAGAGIASTVGIAPALTAGVFATRWAGASLAIYLGLAPKMMARRDKKREAGKQTAIEEYRQKFQEKLALLKTQEEVDEAWEDLQKKEKWYDTKTRLLGMRDTALASAAIGGGLTGGFSWWFFGGNGGVATEAITSTVNNVPSTPGISRISHEGMLGGEPTEAPPRATANIPESPRRAPITRGVAPTITADTPNLTAAWQGINPEGILEEPRETPAPSIPPSPDSVIRSPRPENIDANPGEPRPNEPQFPARTTRGVAGESPEPGMVPPIVPEKSGPIIHKLGKGEGVIKSLELEAKKLGLFKNLPGKEAQTNFIQNRYAMMKGFTPEQLKEIATQPNGRVADLNNLKAGEQLNLTRFFEDQTSVDKGLARSASLSPEEIRQIGENNKIIAERVAEWKEMNPGKRIGDANIENMLKPKASLPGLETGEVPGDTDLLPGVETEPSSASLDKEPVILGSEVQAAYASYLDQKFPSRSFWSFLPWDKKGVDSLEWSQARNFSALEVDKFKGVYGGSGGKDGGAYYGKVGPSILRSQDFSKIQEVVAELKERSGLVPDKTETVEEFAKRAVEETFLNALPGKPTYYTS
ncbi:hypothetical protein K8Q93_00960 [Candidatus Parcubacteria bacterium]|nr:hypothetical protein [Candidatus Parcubacteria bacterium]